MSLHLFNRIVEKVDNLLITFVRNIRSPAHGTDSCFFGRKRGERRDMGLCCGGSAPTQRVKSNTSDSQKIHIFSTLCFTIKVQVR